MLMCVLQQTTRLHYSNCYRGELSRKKCSETFAIHQVQQETVIRNIKIIGVTQREPDVLALRKWMRELRPVMPLFSAESPWAI